MIRKIIHNDNIQELCSFVRKSKSEYFLIVADYDNPVESTALQDFCFAGKMVLPAFSPEELSDLERAYIDSIAELSCEYSSLSWWANPLSEKNEHLSKTFSLICKYYSLIKVLERSKAQNVAVIGDKMLFNQLRIYCSYRNISLISLGVNDVTEKIISVFKKPLSALRLLRYLVKKLIQKLNADIALKKRAFFCLNNSESIYVIRSWINENALKSKGSYKDLFFGSLPEKLKEDGYTVVILAGIINNYHKVLGLLKQQRGFLIVPEELFLNYLDYFKVMYICFFKKIRLKKQVQLMDIDFTRLYREILVRGYEDITFCNNLLRYFIGKGLAQTVPFRFFLQTFENYAWEKLMLLGLRENTTQKKSAHIFGFQHAFITRNSFKYFPGKFESKVMPLPDRIITLGEVTKRILKQHGRYNGLSIESGCALRQEYLPHTKVFSRRPLQKILVPLTMNNDESVKIISFLYKSGIGTEDYKIVIRSHPFAPFELFKEKIPFSLPQNFIVDNKKTVYDELSSTGLIIYTWSTVAVEGLKLGIPLIYLDIARPMCVDPLFQCEHLKCIVSEPRQLLSTIEDIYNMSDEPFLREKKLAQEYLREYFYPVNSEKLKVFTQG